MRLRARVDANQRTIVAALRDMGAGVFPTHMVGRGFPDLVVGIPGRTVLVEVKDGSKPPSARQLTPDELAFHTSWPDTVYVVETIEDAVRLLNEMRR